MPRHLAERAKGFDVTVTDASAETSLIAVQGPAAVAILHEVVDESAKALVSDMSYYAADETTVAGIDVLLARTGYTGEDGFELYVPNAQAAELWDALMAAGADARADPRRSCLPRLAAPRGRHAAVRQRALP